jgi:hypothetical protein
MTTTVLRSTTGRRSPSKWGDVDPATELAAAAAEMTVADDAGIRAAVTGDRKNVNANGPSPPLDNGDGTGRSPGGRGATGENPPGQGRTAEGSREQGVPAALDRPRQGRPEPERSKPAEQQERDLRRAEASLLFLKKGTRKTVPNGFKS